MTPDKPIKKGFNVLEEAEEIRQRSIPSKLHDESFEVFTKYPLSSFRTSFEYRTRTYSAYNTWLDLLSKTRTFPSPQFKDDISELRQEVDTLKVIVRSLTNNVESSNKVIDELSKQLHEKYPIARNVDTYLDKLCNDYIKLVSKVDIVKKIYTVVNETDIQCWTIIDAEPFDSALRKPIYNAQIKIYQEMQGDLALDFHVLNLSELTDRQELERILPPSAKLVWQR